MRFMNGLLDKFFGYFRRFKKLLKIIDKETTMKSVVKSILGALLLSLLVLLLPVLVVVNMFIYAKLTIVLSFILLFFLIMWPFLYYFFYFHLLKNYHPKLEDINTRIPMIVESSFVSLFLLILGIIILATIF